MLLYFRTFITMIVGLYTSRVILHSLGETNYGVYNVVGGIVSMIAFLNGSLSGASSRYLTFAIGEGDAEKLKKVFSAAMNLHFILAAVIIIFGETAGIWLLYNKLVIPADQMNAAFWVLQFSILTSVLSVTSVPYNASLISHENMSVFAYMGLYDVFAKLGIAFLINCFGSDKLFFYALLLFINSVISITIYRIYAIRHYPECRIRRIKDRNVYKNITGYSMWDMLGNISVICQGEGINILLNTFFGPIVNTARAISYQILNGVTVFVGGFTTASRPRVIKYCAEGDFERMYKLTFITAKISYFLVFLLALPIMFEINFILRIWLGDMVPSETSTYTIIIMITALMQTFHTAYLMSFHAVGRIKTGNLICGTLRIMALPISYVALRLDAPSYSVFIIILIINAICHFISWRILYGYVRFDVSLMMKSVYMPCCIVTAFSVIVPTLICAIMSDSVVRFIIICITSELIFLPAAYYIGFSKSERQSIIQPLIEKLKTKLHLIPKTA